MTRIPRPKLLAWLFCISVIWPLIGAALENNSGNEGRDYWFIEVENLTSELMVLEGAVDVQAHQQADNSTWVSYSVAATYPATEVLILIDQHLRDLGFEPLRNDWLSPKFPSSYTRGWTDFEDASSDPPLYVHQWMTHWKNEKGSVVLVDLRYSFPMPINQNELNTPASDTVRITMALLPPDLAKTLFRLATETREQ